MTSYLKLCQHGEEMAGSSVGLGVIFAVALRGLRVLGRADWTPRHSEVCSTAAELRCNFGKA
jgi:hypothetical protein